MSRKENPLLISGLFGNRFFEVNLISNKNTPSIDNCCQTRGELVL